MIQILKVFALALALFSAGFSLAGHGAVEEAVPAFDPESLIRLHVVANSDSGADQALKLKVRDEIVKVTGPAFAGVSDVEGAKKTAANNIELIKEVACRIVAAEGRDDAVEVEFGRNAFPTKSYGSFILPAGDYDAVRVTIGRGDGANWWCVLFPPLCFVDLAKNNLPPVPLIGEGTNPVVTHPVPASTEIKKPTPAVGVVHPAVAADGREAAPEKEEPVVFKSRIMELLGKLFFRGCS